MKRKFNDNDNDEQEQKTITRTKTNTRIKKKFKFSSLFNIISQSPSQSQSHVQTEKYFQLTIDQYSNHEEEEEEEEEKEKGEKGKGRGGSYKNIIKMYNNLPTHNIPLFFHQLLNNIFQVNKDQKSKSKSMKMGLEKEFLYTELLSMKYITIDIFNNDEQKIFWKMVENHEKEKGVYFLKNVFVNRLYHIPEEMEKEMEKKICKCKWYVLFWILNEKKLYDFKMFLKRGLKGMFEKYVEMLDVDDDEWKEIMKFKKSVLDMFLSMNKDVLFIETVTPLHLKKDRHTCIECIPIPKEIGGQASSYFKQAINSCDTEWTQHKKLIVTTGKGLRRSVPLNFPYFHVEFGFNGGFAHVIEDESKFPFRFGKEVISGMLKTNRIENPLNKTSGFEDERKDVLAFLEIYKKFDWTHELD